MKRYLSKLSIFLAIKAVFGASVIQYQYDVNNNIYTNNVDNLNSELNNVEQQRILRPGSIFRWKCSRIPATSTEKPEIKFMLYNRNTHIYGIDITKSTENVLIPNAPIKILLHDYLHDAISPMPEVLKDAYLSEDRGDYGVNVIIVDWSKIDSDTYDNTGCLVKTSNIPLVGEIVAEFITNLIEKQNVNILYINLIGHRLGAQIAGRVGKDLAKRDYKLPIIVGLDPVTPVSGYGNAGLQLAPTDAEYVEVIHTNKNDMGYMTPFGTADFWPDYSQDEIRPAYELFGETIMNPLAFEGERCSDMEALKNNRCSAGTGIIKTFMGGMDMRQGKAAGIFQVKTHRKVATTLVHMFG